MDRVLSFVKGDLEQRQMVGQLEHEREQGNLDMGDDLGWGNGRWLESTNGSKSKRNWKNIWIRLLNLWNLLLTSRTTATSITRIVRRR